MNARSRGRTADAPRSSRDRHGRSRSRDRRKIRRRSNSHGGSSCSADDSSSEMRLRRRHASLLEESEECFCEASRLQSRGELLQERAAAALLELNSVLKQKGKELEVARPQKHKDTELSPPQTAGRHQRSRPGRKDKGKDVGKGNGKGTPAATHPSAACSSKAPMPLRVGLPVGRRPGPQCVGAVAQRPEPTFLERPCRFVEMCAFAPPHE